MNTVSYFENALDSIEKLTPEEQELAIEIIRKRLNERRRNEIISNIEQARIDYDCGDVRRGNIDDLFKEVES